MPNAEGKVEVTEQDIDYVMAVLELRHGVEEYPNEWYETREAHREQLRMSAQCGNWPIREYRAVVAAALAARTREVEQMREANVVADGTARAAVELVQDCRQVLGLDRGDSLTAAVMRAAKDARRYHALRAFLRPEMWGRRWQVVVEADDLRNALAATYSFDTREEVDTDAVVDALAAQEGTR